MTQKFDFTTMTDEFLGQAKKECECFPKDEWPEEDYYFYRDIIKEIKKRGI